MVKTIIMLIMGIIITISPNSLLSTLLFAVGAYLFVVGFNMFVSSLSLLKYSREWMVLGIEAVILLIFGSLLLFNSFSIAKALSGVLFVILGITILAVGIIAIVKLKELNVGILFTVIGSIIAIFPLGVSFFITRIIGLSFIVWAISILIANKTKFS